MSNVIQFPLPPSPRHVEVVWKIRARNAKSFDLIELEHSTEEVSHAAARRLYSRGFDVTVRRHIIEHVVDWVYDEDWNKDR